MSRIGNAPIAVPSGVEVKIADGVDHGEGARRAPLSRPIPGDIQINQDDGTLTVERPNEERKTKALHGLTRSAWSTNMVIGVTEGFKKELEIQGVGYRAEAQGPNALRLNLGFSHPVSVSAPEGITFEVPQQTQVIVVGIDKEVVGQVASDIRSIRKPEPYKGKGVRYAGERIIRKAGKAGKK